MGFLVLIKVISIYSRYAEAIYQGAKLIELRKQSYGLKPGDFLFLYETEPTCLIRGGFLIEKTACLTIAKMWNSYKDILGTEKDFYDSYYSQSSLAYGFHVKAVMLLESPLNKHKLKSMGFIPPMSIAHWRHPLPKELTDLFRKHNVDRCVQSSLPI